MKTNIDKWIERAKSRSFKAQAQKDAAIKLTTRLVSVAAFARMLNDNHERKQLAIAAAFMDSRLDYYRLLSKVNMLCSCTTSEKTFIISISREMHQYNARLNSNNFVESYSKFVTSMLKSFGVKVEISVPLKLLTNRSFQFKITDADIQTMRNTISAKVNAVSKGKYQTANKTPTVETIMNKLETKSPKPANLSVANSKSTNSEIDTKIFELELQLDKLKKQQQSERLDLVNSETAEFLNKFNWVPNSTKTLIAKYIKDKLS